MAARAKKTTTSKKTASKKSEILKPSKSPRKVNNSVSLSALPEEPKEFTSQKKSKKTLLILAVLVVVLGLLYYFKDVFVVATVNGKPITRYTVVSEAEKRNGKDVLDNLVTKELILQESSKKGITVSQADVDNEMKKIEEDLSKQNQKLDDVLAMQGLTRADVEDNLRIKLYIERLLADKVDVSDDDAQKYFDENKAGYGKDAKFEDQKDQIKEQLKGQKLQEQFQSWLTDLKANAKINYFKTY